MQTRDPDEGDNLTKVTAVFVHGILGRPQAWADMLEVLGQDQELADVTVEEFTYWSPWFNFAPARVVPRLGAIASQLRTFLRHRVERDRSIVLVTHSMGGLVAQRYISDMLSDGEGEQLRRIAAVVMYACPNSGSEFLLGARKLLLWIPGLRHRQERHLRPHDREVMDARRRVVSHAVYATSVSSSSCPIAVFSYGGAEDRVVDGEIARDVFPRYGTLPGDHSSIIRPERSTDTRYRVLSDALRDARHPPDHPAAPSKALISRVIGEVPSAPKVHVEREQATQLSALLKTPNDHRRVVVLTGPPGVGKTEIAAAVARTATSSVPFVAWVRAEQIETLYADLARAADSLGITQVGDSHRLAGRVVDYLSSTDERGLIVFDNASVEPVVLRRLLPAVGGTRVLITSTDQSHASLGQRMEVDSFDHSDAVRYLTRAVPHLSESDADDLAIRLDDYPLALEQASAYMRLHRLTVDQYSARLDSMPLARAIPQPAGSAYPRSVAAAVRLSFETSIAGASELCATAVGVLALVAQEALPWQLASADWPRDPQQPHDAIFTEAFERSSTLSLLSVADTGHLRVHRLVGQIILEHLSAGGHERDILATAISWLKPKLFDNAEAWLRRHDGVDLVSRIEAVSSFALRAQNQGDDDLIAGVFSARSWAVRQLWKATDLESAQQLAARVAAEASTVAGAESGIALNATYDLAACYESAGRVGTAIQLFEHVRAAHAVRDGEVDGTTAPIAHSLARAYRSAGRFSQALPLMQSVHEFLSRDRRSEDRFALAAATDLAGLYESMGDVDRSIELFDRALRARVITLGPEDPHTLSSRKHLAGALESAGRLDEAIDLYRQTLRQREQHLPVDHPHTLISRSDLGYALESRSIIQGVESEEALDILRQSVDDRTRVLGYSNPDALVARCDYGAALVRRGELEAGTALLLATLVDSEDVLGTLHPNTATVRHAVARAKRAAGDLGGALELFDSVLADRISWWPASNPDVCITRTDRAMTLAVLGQGDPAGDLGEVVEEATTRLGRDHPATIVFAEALEIVTSLSRLKDFRERMPWNITEARWRAGRRMIKRPLD